MASSCSRPSRITFAWRSSTSRNASTARSARASCTKPSTAFSRTIAPIATASTYSPIEPGDGRSSEQQPDERIGELAESDRRVRWSRRASESIGAEAREPVLRLVLSEPALEIGAELASYVPDGSSMRSIPRLHGQITRAAATCRTEGRAAC